MAISSSATGLRPGVCTSTTRPTAPYTGQIIYETDTGYLRVWDGSAWDYLSQKQDDTVGLGPVGGLVYVASTSPSAASTPAIDGCFTSTYAHYFITYNLTTSLTGQYTALRLRASGTAKATNYDRSAFYTTTAGASGVDGYGTSQTEWFVGGQSTTLLVGNCYIYNPQISGRTGFTGHAAYPGAYLAQGSQTDTYQADGFQIFASGNAATYTGTIRVYGIRNS